MQSVEKTLYVLESIAKLTTDSGFSVADLAGKTSLNLSTIHRIFSILVKRGYIYQKHKRSRYFIGHKFLLFSGMKMESLGIKEQALPFLEVLCHETSETIDLVTFDGINLISLATVFPKQVLRAIPDLTIVQPLPLHCTATGKIILASLPADKYENIIDTRELTAYTDNTNTDKEILKTVVDKVRLDKIAYDIEEYLPGVLSVAAPIADHSEKTIGAVSLVGPSIRLNRLKLRQFAPMVKNCAEQISRIFRDRDELASKR